MVEPHITIVPLGEGSSTPQMQMCNDHYDLERACDQQVFNTRHGKCAQHMSCLQFNEEDPSSCMYVPSSCIVCNNIIQHMDNAITSGDKDRMRDARTGTKLLEQLIEKLEGTFETVTHDEPLIIKWFYSVKAMKGITFTNYITNQHSKAAATTIIDIKQSSRNIAIKIHQDLGWTWVDNRLYHEFVSNTGIKGILDTSLNRHFFPSEYKTITSQGEMFFKLKKPLVQYGDITKPELIALQRKTLQAAFEPEDYSFHDLDAYHHTLIVKAKDSPTQVMLKDQGFIDSLAQYTIPNQTSFGETAYLHILAEDPDHEDFNKMLARKPFLRSINNNIAGLQLRNPSRDYIDKLNETKNELKVLSTVNVGIDHLTQNSLKLIESDSIDVDLKDKLKASLLGIQLFNNQLSWPLRNATIRHSKAMKSTRRSAMTHWSSGIIAIEDLIHKDTLGSEIFFPNMRRKLAN